jgi:benzylsuccinate CoA-transferase BbsF subunit
LLHRKEHESELDEIVRNWTVRMTPEEVMELLQKAGVPAGLVSNADDLFRDPQLRHRGLFWPIEHPEMGMFTHLGASLHMSKTPAEPYKPSPCIGEHNEYVLTKILGKTDEEFVELLAEGVLE